MYVAWCICRPGREEGNTYKRDLINTHTLAKETKGILCCACSISLADVVKQHKVRSLLDKWLASDLFIFIANSILIVQ